MRACYRKPSVHGRLHCIPMLLRYGCGVNGGEVQVFADCQGIMRLYSIVREVHEGLPNNGVELWKGLRPSGAV